MKSASSGMIAHIAQGQTTLTTCLKLTLLDGTVIGTTEHDKDLVFSGVTYRAQIGFTKFNLADKSNGDASNIQLKGMVDPTYFTADAIRARKFDYAAVELFLLNWADTSPTMGRIQLPATGGKLGVVTLDEFEFSVDLFGLSYRLTQTGGELLSRECRVDFGSPRCAPGGALDDATTIDSLMQTGTVATTDGRKTLTFTGLTDTGKPFNGGLVTWLTGENQNLSIEVGTMDFGTSTIMLYLKSFLPITVGDTFKIQPACDHSLGMCGGVWSNAKNFQGEPNVPGDDALLNYPDYHAPHR
jgi:uncharacterized phage protein (TIGR02218 family)